MQVQSPFVVPVDSSGYRSFADFFFSSIADYGSRTAMVDEETNKQWRFGEFQQWTEKAVCRLRECGVTSGSRVAVVSASTPLSIFVQLALSILGARVACLNGLLSFDELWHQIDACEATHCVVQTEFGTKIDEVRRKAIMRGSGRIRVIRRLDEITGDVPLLKLQKRDSRTTITQQNKDTAAESTDSFTAIETASGVSISTVVLRSNAKQVNEMAEDRFIHSLNGQDEQEEETKSLVEVVERESNKSAPFLVLFSSGTTRFARPVEISHQTLITTLQRLRSPVYGPPTAKDRFLLPICLHHIFGWYSAFHALINGAELVMLPNGSNKHLLKALIEHKACLESFGFSLIAMQITYVHLLPHTIQFLANDLSLENVTLRPHLRTIITAGSTLDARIARQCKERLGVRDIRQMYGMTELGGPCVFSHVGSENLESVGQPMPGFTLKVVHFESKKLCAPRQAGHLLVSGPNIPACVFRNNKLNAELTTADGFVKTGDAAFYDERGFIYVLDRIKDIIKYKGTLVCPSEVESTLRTHPGVEDAAVVGRSDHVSGEVPAAFVIKRHSHSMLSTAEIRTHVSGKIPQFKELRGGVFFISEIPRSVCGKIIRQQLRNHWDRERSGSKADALNGAAGTTAAVLGSPTGAKNGTRRPSAILPPAVQRAKRVPSAHARKFGSDPSNSIKKASA